MEKKMSELVFVVEEASEGGFTAKALGVSIFTEAETMSQLRTQILDAVRCHFEPGQQPSLIRLHTVKDEIIAA